MPVFCLKIGRMCPNRPESSVDVVDATMTVFSCARAGASIATNIASPRNRRLIMYGSLFVIWNARPLAVGTIEAAHVDSLFQRVNATCLMRRSMRPQNWALENEMDIPASPFKHLWRVFPYRFCPKERAREKRKGCSFTGARRANHQKLS